MHKKVKEEIDTFNYRFCILKHLDVPQHHTVRGVNGPGLARPGPEPAGRARTCLRKPGGLGSRDPDRIGLVFIKKF